MAVATFDTLKFANSLKAAGVPDKQAEAEAVFASRSCSASWVWGFDCFLCVPLSAGIESAIAPAIEVLETRH